MIKRYDLLAVFWAAMALIWVVLAAESIATKQYSLAALCLWGVLLFVILSAKAYQRFRYYRPFNYYGQLPVYKIDPAKSFSENADNWIKAVEDYKKRNGYE